jgi:multiple sugar transport system ATP-binding protein
MASVLLDAVSVERSGTQVIHNLTLSVEDQELLALIGPSGCGKTTLLRAVAGLDSLSGGDILFDGRSMAGVTAARRDVAMVFQDNALIPRKTVRQNVAFPLEVHHVNREEIDRRVLAETRTMAIDRFLDRMPSQLSAGHQQLVQAARALVRRPSLFLLDEPLSRMDAANRHMMRSEIRLLQTGYGVTTLYATNDQEEAMAIADRIAVIDEGRLRQLGTSREIYERPIDTFVASFVGSPSMSFLPGVASDREVHISAGSLPVPPQTRSGPVTVGVRPHEWHIVPTAGLPGTVQALERHGDFGFATVDLESDQIVMRVHEDQPAVGDKVELWTRRYHIFGPTGRAVAHIG